MTLALIVFAAAVTSKLALANVLVGFLLPHAIAVLNQCKWQPRTKACVAFVCCLAAAAITAYASGKLTPTDWALSAMTVFVAAQISYKGLWKPTGITTSIEKATSTE